MSGARYTFKANRDRGRHGWLRLTPAYSVNLVEEFVDRLGGRDRVLDPFCGTGTTALVCANRGIPCVTIDINPFLVWFATAKVRPYGARECDEALHVATSMRLGDQGAKAWVPPMNHIERWWDEETVRELANLWKCLLDAEVEHGARDILKIGFCQLLMERSRANFRHQSISLKHDISPKIPDTPTARTAAHPRFVDIITLITTQARNHQPATSVSVLLGDARNSGIAGIPDGGGDEKFTAVITSPPYANRMSYIRELRPYMYWLGFLDSGESAGNLDWEAIGGTWGRATSNLLKWTPSMSPPLDAAMAGAVDEIERRSIVLGRYVRRYIEDAATHIRTLRSHLAPGATVAYIVGNSRFYDQLLSTERIYATLFESTGLIDVNVESIRKRTSKRELFEFAVTARAPD